MQINLLVHFASVYFDLLSNFTILQTEHRNMPLEDALTLISSSFKKYLQNMREKEVTAAAPLVVEKESTAAAIVKAFLPPSKDVSYLLNLLADNRQLTVEELDKVIFYLRERRDKILEAEGRPKITTEGKYIGLS